MEKMIRCKACGKEIAKSAKSCPHCGAKNKKPPVGCLIALIVVLLLMIVGMTGEDDGPVKVPNESQPGAQTTQPAEDPVFSVGDTAAMDDIYVTLVDIHEYDGDFMHPEDGNTYVGFELLIENKSDKPIVVSSLMCFEAYFDDFATNYSLGAQTESDLNQLDGEIAPGKKITGAMCYEVPADWTTAELHFNPDWGNKEFVFNYSK